MFFGEKKIREKYSQLLSKNFSQIFVEFDQKRLIYIILAN